MTWDNISGKRASQTDSKSALSQISNQLKDHLTLETAGDDSAELPEAGFILPLPATGLNEIVS